MVGIAVNGFGRMGKLFLRAFLDEERSHDIVLLNERGAAPDEIPLLLQFDTVHGRWDRPIGLADDLLSVGSSRIRVSECSAIDRLPIGETGARLVVDCTGAFKMLSALAPYFECGIEKVVVSAPVKEEGALNLVYGVNHDRYRPDEHCIVTAASCTTNCIAPVVKVLHEEIGIMHGSVTTIHAATNTQTIVDRPARSPRRARSVLNSLVPTTTGSATAIGYIFPELKGRLDGHAVRVPILNASLADCVFEVARPTTAEEVNGHFRRRAAADMAGILGYEEKQLVSADFVGDDRSAIVDAATTIVTNGTQVKVYAWYDNEWAYVRRLVDIALLVADSMQ